jgi:formamidopyrimidine-DNA glycosylase
MPELPDLTVYVEHLARLRGAPLRQLRVFTPFLLRSVAPTVDEFAGRALHGVRRIGKRIVLDFDGDLFAVLHLMIAGRLRWFPPGRKAPARITQAQFEFDSGTLAFTEAGTKRRASLHLVRGAAELQRIDPGGIDVLDLDHETFAQRLTVENHTLKRALTEPRLFAGIGNAYSDEILHRARLSPLALTQQLAPEQVERLHRAVQEVLVEWITRLRARHGADFPNEVSAFQPEMAVHGKFGQPCPVCGAPVQRIVYADNEANYCARCQTGGRLLADRALSRLLKASWPRSIDELG